jgi:hypothetical protein
MRPSSDVYVKRQDKISLTHRIDHDRHDCIRALILDREGYNSIDI